MNDINKYLPLEIVGQCSILITMQKPTGSLAVKDLGIIPVNPLTRDDAAKLMLKYIQAGQQTRWRKK